MAKASKADTGVSVDARDFAALLGKTSAFSARLRRELRDEIRREASRAVVDVQAEVRKSYGTVSTKPQPRGVREGIARGVKVQLAANSKTRIGVFIKGTSTGLPKGKRRLAAVWDKEKGWRHPVFADARRISRAKEFSAKTKGTGLEQFGKDRATLTRRTAKWVEQKGRPFFGTVIIRHQDEIARGVRRALDDAARRL